MSLFDQFEDREASRGTSFRPGEHRPAPVPPAAVGGVNVSTFMPERRSTASRSLELAHAERDLAMTRVESAAPVEWRITAWAWLLDYLATHAEFFPDDVWEAGLEVPPERRAFGPLVQRAAREGLIVKAGYMRARTLGHATRAEVWKPTIHQEAS